MGARSGGGFFSNIGKSFSNKILKGLGRTGAGRTAMVNSAKSLPSGASKSHLLGVWRKSLAARPAPRYAANAKMIDGVPVPKPRLGGGASVDVARGAIKTEQAAMRAAASPAAQGAIRGLSTAQPITGGADALMAAAGGALKGARIPKGSTRAVRVAGEALQGLGNLV